MKIILVRKKINTLINLLRNIGKAFCNEGTFEESSSNDIVQKWKYRGDTFRMTFPKTPNDEITIKKCYAQIRMKLREKNLKASSESSMRLVGNYAKVEELVLLDELWEELDANS